MSIEDTLERIATALEKIEARFAGDVPAKPPAAAPAKPETAAQKKKRLKAEAVAAEAAADPLADDEAPTKDDVRDLLTSLTEEHGRDVIVALFGKLGVKNLKELDPAKYGEAIEMGQDAIDNGPGKILDDDS